MHCGVIKQIFSFESLLTVFQLFPKYLKMTGNAGNNLGGPCFWFVGINEVQLGGDTLTPF